ncbi:pimeloyl-ACP methyl ester carboxylesterase [Bradyrhizobium sp. USDA 4369]
MNQSQSTSEPLVLADQGFFWTGVQRQQTPNGTIASGQMFVQYQIPERIRSPYPIVLVHGGGGQGLDYLGTHDGRPGWATYFLRQGFAVYVVDRPGHGRSPLHPDALGPMTPSPNYELAMAMFTAPGKQPSSWPNASRHTQWPGPGVIGDPGMDQFMAGQGPFLVFLAQTQQLMQKAGAELLDRIGPAILLTHSMGAPFGWLVADARPKLVKGIIAIEPMGPPFSQLPMGLGDLSYGLTAIAMSFDPPVKSPTELGRETRKAPRPGLADCFVQKHPARKLPNLASIPVAVVTSEASAWSMHDHGTVDFLLQAGVPAVHLRLEEMGLRGNGHLMMQERNSDEIAGLLTKWISEHVSAKI